MANADRLPPEPGPDDSQRSIETNEDGRITSMTLPAVGMPAEGDEPVGNPQPSPTQEPAAKPDAQAVPDNPNDPLAPLPPLDPEVVAPKDPAQQDPNDPTPRQFTLEEVFNQVESGAAIPEDMGLRVIDQISQAFGGDTDRAAEMAKQYFDGREAQTKLTRLELISESLPSFDRYNEVLNFAKQHPAVAQEYNALVSVAQTREDAVRALRTLNARYDAHYGAPGQTVTAATAPQSSAIEYIESRQQLYDLQFDERYSRDPKFRKEVMGRLKQSIDAGRYSG